MKIRTICSALILGGSIAAAPATLSLAQTSNQGTLAPKEAATPPPSGATPNMNTNPTKHRYWRHRGGSHPHYGSRRVRT